MKNYQAMTEIELCDEFKHWLEDDEVRAIMAEVKRRTALVAMTHAMAFGCGDMTQAITDQTCIKDHGQPVGPVGGRIGGQCVLVGTPKPAPNEKTPAENGEG